MRLNSVLKSILIFSFVVLCQCKLSPYEKGREVKDICVVCLNCNCCLNHNTVIVLLDNNDCALCTETIERMAHIMTDKIPKERMALVLRNFDDRKLTAYKRTMVPFYGQILIEGSDVNIESRLDGSSHFIMFSKSQNKYIAYTSDQFSELLDCLNIN